MSTMGRKADSMLDGSPPQFQLKQEKP
jgi:hypothetical protein